MASNEQTITNIHLVDCNRVNSEEYKDNNDKTPASWRNVVSGGLKLNAGDKVSVAYSCINEVGCGSGQIETKGKVIGSYNFEDKEIKGDLTESPLNRWEQGPFATNYTEYRNVKKEHQVRDNEFNVVLSYYKNTNGENYLHLPRRYDSKIDLQKPVSCDVEGTMDGQGPKGWQTDLNLRKRIWTQGDGKSNGRPQKIPAVRVFDDWHWYMGNKRYVPHSEVVAGGMEWKTNPNFILHEGNEVTSCSPYWDENRWKQKNDNTRYTIFMSKYQYWSHKDLTADQIAIFDKNYFSVRDPALQEYTQYKEWKNYSITAGFNDPNNVAYQLTSQFSDPIKGPQARFLHQRDFDTSATTGAGVGSVRVVPDFPCAFTSTSIGETYKPFPASNYKTMSRGVISTDAGATTNTELGSYACYNNGLSLLGQIGTGTDPEKELIKKLKQEDIVNYQSSFNCIGVKRPEFWNAGREMTMNHLYPDRKITGLDLGRYNGTNGICGTADSIVTPDDPVAKTPATLDWWNIEDVTRYTNKNHRWMKTRIPWKDDTLKAISKFLKTQALYPELLDFGARDTVSLNGHTSALHIMDTPPVPPNLLTEEQLPSGTNQIASVFHKRFLHIDPFNDLDAQRHLGQFGDDMSGKTSRTSGGDTTGGRTWIENSGTASLPMWFYYDPTMEDTYYDTLTYKNLDGTGAQDDSDNEGQLCYGFAQRWVAGTGESAHSYIALNIRGISEQLMDMMGAKHINVPSIIGNYIGYDFHYNAYGNSCIQLYTGILPENSDGKQLVGINSQGTPQTFGGVTSWKANGGPSQMPETSGNAVGRPFQPHGYNIASMLRQVYIGAIDPIIQFVSANSRFTFGGLHTPEQIQNGNNAGSPLKAETAEGSITTVPIEDDAGTDVYKMNKRFTMWNNYCPEILPYRTRESFKAPYWENDYHASSKQGDNYHVRAVGQVRGGMYSGTDTFNGIQTPYYLLGKVNNGGMYPDGGVGNQYGSAPNGVDRKPPDDGTNNFQNSEANASGGALYHKATIHSTTEGSSRELDPYHQYEEINNNISPWIIYDSHSGIFLEDFVIDDLRTWEKSLFGIMGLSFAQMNPTADKQMNRQTKLTRVNYKNVSPLTTCALVPQKDLPTYIKNLWQKPMYSQQIPTPIQSCLWYGLTADYYSTHSELPSTANWELFGSAGGISRRFFHIGDVNMPNIVAEVVNPQTTHSIMCDGLPIKMKSPYYLIKSDLLADSYYIRDKTPLPIVAVINKENFFGDFAFSQQSQLEYTVTEEKVITSIRTEIYDADMSHASVNDASGVIYKIIKSVPMNTNLIQDLLAPNPQDPLVMAPKKGVIGNFGNQPTQLT